MPTVTPSPSPGPTSEACGALLVEPRTVLVVPVGKTFPEFARAAGRALHLASSSCRPTMLVDTYSSPDNYRYDPVAVATVSFAQALHDLTGPQPHQPSGPIVVGWEDSRHLKSENHRALSIAADVIRLVHAGHAAGLRVVLIGPPLLPGQEWLYAGVGLPLADLVVLAATSDQLGSWARLPLALLTDDERHFPVPRDVAAIVLGTPEFEFGDVKALAALKGLIGKTMRLGEKMLQALADGQDSDHRDLLEVLGDQTPEQLAAQRQAFVDEVVARRAAEEADDEAAQADADAAVQELAPLRDHLQKIRHAQHEAAQNVARSAERMLSVGQLDALVGLLEDGMAVVDAHPVAFRHFRLHLGDFWLDALECAGDAAWDLGAHPDQEQLRRAVRALVRVLWHARQPLDIGLRADAVLRAVLNAAWDDQIDELAIQTAVALDAADGEPAGGAFTQRVHELAQIRHLMPGDRPR